MLLQTREPLADGCVWPTHQATRSAGRSDDMGNGPVTRNTSRPCFWANQFRVLQYAAAPLFLAMRRLLLTHANVARLQVLATRRTEVHAARWREGTSSSLATPLRRSHPAAPSLPLSWTRYAIILLASVSLSPFPRSPTTQPPPTLASAHHGSVLGADRPDGAPSTPTHTTCASAQIMSRPPVGSLHRAHVETNGCPGQCLKLLGRMTFPSWIELVVCRSRSQVQMNMRKV